MKDRSFRVAGALCLLMAFATGVRGDVISTNKLANSTWSDTASWDNGIVPNGFTNRAVFTVAASITNDVEGLELTELYADKDLHVYGEPLRMGGAKNKITANGGNVHLHNPVVATNILDVTLGGGRSINFYNTNYFTRISPDWGGASINFYARSDVAPANVVNWTVPPFDLTVDSGNTPLLRLNGDATTRPVQEFSSFTLKKGWLQLAIDGYSTLRFGETFVQGHVSVSGGAVELADARGNITGSLAHQ